MGDSRKHPYLYHAQLFGSLRASEGPRGDRQECESTNELTTLLHDYYRKQDTSQATLLTHANEGMKHVPGAPSRKGWDLGRDQIVFSILTNNSLTQNAAFCKKKLFSLVWHKNVWTAALQAATILVAMASEKKFWRPKFSGKSPIGDQQIKRETYLKNYQ